MDLGKSATVAKAEIAASPPPSDVLLLESPAISPRREQICLIVARIVVGVGALLCWEGVSGSLVNPFWISSPSGVVIRLVDWIGGGLLWHHIGVTLTEVCVGYALGAIGGIIFGLILGLNPWLARVLDPYIVAVYSIPKIALAPLFIVWFGLGMESKIFLVFVVVLFLVFYNSYSGVREVDSELKDVMRLMGARRSQIIRKLVLPSAIVWIFTGMKISVPYALVAAVVGEIMASNRGLGFLIQSSAGQFDTSGVFAAIFVLVIISTIFNGLLRYSEGVFLRWKQ